MSKRLSSKSAKRAPVKDKSAIRTWLIWGSVALGVIALGFLLFLSIKGPSPIRDMITFARPARGHDNEIDIEAEGLPPVGGTHHDNWQNCGIYTEPIGSGNAVHSMEHGAVWITYQPDLPEEDIAYLQDLVRGQNYLLLSPYPGLKSPVVLTAWGLQLEVDSAQDNRVDDFIERYQSGPQTPERGASCRDGVGQPVQ